MAEAECGACGRDQEGEGGVEVGEGTVDESNGAKGVRCCESRCREAGEGKSKTSGCLEVEESCGFLSNSRTDH